MARCAFCDDEVKRGTGILFVKKDGKSFMFCSSKCQKNTKLKREGRRQKWTKAFASFHVKGQAIAKKKSKKKKGKKKR